MVGKDVAHTNYHHLMSIFGLVGKHPKTGQVLNEKQREKILRMANKLKQALFRHDEL